MYCRPAEQGPNHQGCASEAGFAYICCPHARSGEKKPEASRQASISLCKLLRHDAMAQGRLKKTTFRRQFLEATCSACDNARLAGQVILILRKSSLRLARNGKGTICIVVKRMDSCV